MAGPSAARALKRVLSDVEGVSPFLQKLSQEATELYRNCQQMQKPMLSFAREWQATMSIEPQHLYDDYHGVVSRLHGQNEAETFAGFAKALQPEDAIFTGQLPTTPAHWTYGPESMWHGDPPNDKVLKFMKAIIYCTYKKEEPIMSRSVNLTATAQVQGPNGVTKEIVAFKLQLGDGSARQVAVCLIWTLLVKHVTDIPAGDAQTKDLVDNLWTVPASFKIYGQGSNREALLAQAAQQNQRAQARPVQTLDWIHMLLSNTGMCMGGAKSTRKELTRHMESLFAAYHKLPDVEAFAIDQPAKRPRHAKGRHAPETDNTGNIRVGSAKKKAIQNILDGLPLQTFRALREAEVFTNMPLCDDETLCLPYLYVGSRAPKESFLEEEARPVELDMVDELMVVNVDWDMPLSEQVCDLMWSKAQTLFKHHCNTLNPDDLRGKAQGRPKGEDFRRYRLVVDLWCGALEPCAAKDLSAEDYRELKRVVLESSSMDSDLAQLSSKRPSKLHLAMVPGLMSHVHVPMDSTDFSTAGRIRAKQRAAVEANLVLFEEQLHEDWTKIIELAKGFVHLQDTLAWLASKHRRQEMARAAKALEKFTHLNYPGVQVDRWEQVSAQVSRLLQGVDYQTKGRRILVGLLDFNTPHARASLKIQQSIQAVQSTLALTDPAHAILMCWMPSAPKEHCDMESIEQDEETIRKLLKANKFVYNTRIRMQFDMPESSRKRISKMALWADGRLCAFTNTNLFVHHSELARILRLWEIPVLPEVADLVMPKSLDPNEDIGSSEHFKGRDAASRAAQRGPKTCAMQLRALLSPAASADRASWVQADDLIVVLDFLPYVGDRALGSYLLSQEGQAPCPIRHVLINVGKEKTKCLEFVHDRLNRRFCDDWMGRSLTLTEQQTDSKGDVLSVVIRPYTEAPPPTEEELSKTLGALAAWKGLGEVQLKVCEVKGTKFKLVPKHAIAFQEPGLANVLEEFEFLRARHVREYECILDGVVHVSQSEEESKDELEEEQPHARILGQPLYL